MRSHREDERWWCGDDQGEKSEGEKGTGMGVEGERRDTEDGDVGEEWGWRRDVDDGGKLENG